MAQEEPLVLGSQDFCGGMIQEELEFGFSKASVVHRVGGEGMAQGSPSLGPWIRAGLWPVRNWVGEQTSWYVQPFPVVHFTR